MVEYDADLLDPIFRAFYSSILTKITNFTISELSILTDDEISDLVKEKFSHLPDAEVDRIIEAEISSFFGPIQALISLLSIFFPKHEEITPPPTPSVTLPEKQQDVSDPSLTFNDIFMYGAAGLTILVIISVGLYDLRQWWLNSWFRSWMYKDVTNTTAKQELLKLSKRSRSLLSKYEYARRAIVSKGLKGIGETYIGATNMVFRQDLLTEGFRAASERNIWSCCSEQ